MTPREAGASRSLPSMVRRLSPPIAWLSICGLLGTLVPWGLWRVAMGLETSGAVAQSAGDMPLATGLVSMLWPSAILLLNPDAPASLMAILLFVNGAVFVGIGFVAWRVALQSTKLVALGIALGCVALLSNNYWGLVAVSLAVEKGATSAIGAVSIVHWPSFGLLATLIVLAFWSLHRYRREN